MIFIGVSFFARNAASSCSKSACCRVASSETASWDAAGCGSGAAGCGCCLIAGICVVSGGGRLSRRAWALPAARGRPALRELRSEFSGDFFRQRRNRLRRGQRRDAQAVESGEDKGQPNMKYGPKNVRPEERRHEADKRSADPVALSAGASPVTAVSGTAIGCRVRASGGYTGRDRRGGGRRRAAS